MLSPQDLIGQKVWLSVQRELYYADSESQRIKAEITQPTSPPWFFARYLDPPASISTSGQWMSLYEAQQAVLLDPVIDYDEYEDENFPKGPHEDEFSLP
jgi:hypothetical protein